MNKTLIGTVSSTKGDKTIIVTVSSSRTHPIYKKKYSLSNKLMAHDEKNECLVGDVVQIRETRPISRRKSFILTKIVQRPAIRAEERVDALDSVAVIPDKPTQPVTKQKDGLAKQTASENKTALAPKAIKKVAKKEAK